MPLTREQISEINICVADAIKNYLENHAFIENVVKRVSVAMIDNMQKELEEFIQAVIQENIILKERIDHLEQYSRRNNIRIFGMAEKQKENLEDSVIDIFEKKLNVYVPKEAIERIHRTGRDSEGKTRPVIIKFLSYKTRQQVLNNKKKLKGTNFIVYEDLTKTRLSILHKVQTRIGRRNTWTQDGTIFFRRDNSIYAIKSSEDFDKYFKDVTVAHSVG
ncbi:hypothetical protein ILUMI_19529 [Ignelater luminosus]|uniref:Uncharacterized protein n=1 Tax=Ignelater luminosus TaxID=2038154 RepID=A0A8K0CMV3_IGNLU|nr:hypothetical protein ILUMI_19529 [Ignelater luminosus]